MKTFNHYIQHLITQQTSIGSLIAKALHSEQTKKLVSNALSSELRALITDIHAGEGIVTFLCSTAEKATFVRFESIDLLSLLRQSPKLGHIKKIQVRVVPAFLATQSSYFTTGNHPSTLKSITEKKDKSGKMSKSNADQLSLLADSLGGEVGCEELKASLRKLAKRL